MLDILVASRSSRFFNARWLSGSLLIHLTLAAVTVEGTRVAARATGPVVADTTLLYLPRLAPPTVPRPALARPAAVPGGGGTGGVVVSATPPPRGFQTVLAPADIPTSIPPVDLEQPTIDPRNFTGQGVEGGLGWGIDGGTGPTDQELPATVGAEDVVYAATLTDARFEPAELLSMPAPRYPRALEILAIAGRVVVQFIIDTSGTVEAPSMHVVESTHREFEESALESVSRARFRPAHLGAFPVRQLTRQPISFVVQQ